MNSEAIHEANENIQRVRDFDQFTLHDPQTMTSTCQIYFLQKPVSLCLHESILLLIVFVEIQQDLRTTQSLLTRVHEVNAVWLEGICVGFYVHEYQNCNHWCIA